MKINHIIIYLFLLLSAACTSTKTDHDHAEGEHSHEDQHAHETDDHHEEEDLVELESTQLQKIQVRYGKIEQKNLKSMLKVNGQVELPPQNQADVSALAPGRIAKVHIKPGQSVKRGTVLASLQNPDFIGWQQAYLETKGELMFLEKELVRQKDLVKKEIAAQKQLDQVESSHAVASAQLKGLASKLKTLGLPIPADASAEFTSFINITSPITGHIEEIKINTGTYVSAEQQLFEIVDNHHLHLDLTVFEKDIPYLFRGQKLLFSLQSNPKEVMEAEVLAVGKALDEEIRAVSVHAHMMNQKPTILPGMYIEARIILEDQSVPALPEEAITLDKGLRYIFVKDHVDGDHVAFRKVQVIPGAEDFGYVEVNPLEDLTDDTQIVVAGAYFLMAESKKGEEGGGHSHAH